MKACIDCGSTHLATYTNRGKVRPRTRCVDCFSKHNTAYHREKRAARPKLPDGWKVVESARKCPPQGVKRVVIDSRSHKVTIYADGLRKTWKFNELKVLNNRIKLWAAYESMGYTLTKRLSWQITLEKAS